MSEHNPLTELIRRAADGDQSAADALFETTHGELRRLARHRLRGGGRQAQLETSSLINELFLRFASAQRLRFEDRVHFMRWASKAMRSVIVDHVRRFRAQRRGGDAVHVTLTTRIGLDEQSPDREILRVHEALEQVASIEPRLAQVVEMRYFAGMTEAEIASALGVTDRTVRRDWEKARLLLRSALS